jgi:hypothetical protein
MKPTKELRKLLIFLGLVLATAILIITGMSRLSAQTRVPNGEQLPSASPPEQCIPSQKASWLLPISTDLLWKRLEKDSVSFWVPSRYQISEAPNRSLLSDPTAKYFKVVISTTGTKFRTRAGLEEFINRKKETLSSDQGKIAFEEVSLANYIGFRVMAEHNTVDLINRQLQEERDPAKIEQLQKVLDVFKSNGNATSVSYFLAARQSYFHTDVEGQRQSTLWGIWIVSFSPEFYPRASEVEKIVCSFSSK